MLATVSPLGAQSNGELPDLISDPPVPGYLSVLTDDTSSRLVMTFDGYIHNIGEGPLDIVGNPQVDDGMVQRVRDGDRWLDVATPTVRYETDDGHNHFHLIEVVEYVLWNEDQGSQTAVGSKIGFCLVDSEQVEIGNEQAYSEELDNFCQENNPSATSLRMGITPGWRDIYDRTTTLQWVDVSDTAPGRYWIGAITDPNDEVVESDEDNNGLVFSTRPGIVPGWLPSDTDVTADGQPVDIDLELEPFGVVSSPIITIETAPANGHLTVPEGASITGPSLRYTPAVGFTGADSFEFSVRDANSPFPLTAPTATVEIDVTAAVADGGDAFPPGLLLDSTFIDLTVGDPVDVSISAATTDGAPVTLSATGLPAGLRIEDERLVGTALATGISQTEIVATDAGGQGVTRFPLSIIVERGDPGLVAQPAWSVPLSAQLRERVGTAVLGSQYEADGLPPGVSIEPLDALLVGAPTEVGEFTAEIRRLEQGEVVESMSMIWTVRPAISISFPI